MKEGALNSIDQKTSHALGMKIASKYTRIFHVNLSLLARPILSGSATRERHLLAHLRTLSKSNQPHWVVQASNHERLPPRTAIGSNGIRLLFTMLQIPASKEQR